MLQTFISTVLTDLIKLVALAAGSFLTFYIKQHADLAKLQKAQQFLSSKSAAAELVKKVTTEVGDVLTSSKTVDKGAAVIANFAKKKGLKITKEETAELLKQLQESGEQVAGEVQKAAEEAAKAHIKVDSTKLSNAIEPAVLKLSAELAQSYADVPATEADTGDATSADQEPAEQQAQAPVKAAKQPAQAANATKPAAAAQSADSQKKVGDMTLDELKKALK